MKKISDVFKNFKNFKHKQKHETDIINNEYYLRYIIDADTTSTWCINTLNKPVLKNNMTVYSLNLCNDHPEHILQFTFTGELLKLLSDYIFEYKETKNAHPYNCHIFTKYLKFGKTSMDDNPNSPYCFEMINQCNDLKEYYSCGNIVMFFKKGTNREFMMTNNTQINANKAQELHSITSTGLKHPHTGETLFFSKNGNECMQISTIRKLLAIYSETEFVMRVNLINKDDKDFDLCASETSYVKPEWISMNEVILSHKFRSTDFSSNTVYNDVLNNITKKINIFESHISNNNCILTTNCRNLIGDDQVISVYVTTGTTHNIFHIGNKEKTKQIYDAVTMTPDEISKFHFFGQK